MTVKHDKLGLPKNVKLENAEVFDFDETVDVFNLMASTFQRAIEDGATIKAEKI